MAGTKLTLIADPTFDKKVEIPQMGKPPVEIRFTFKHRTQEQLDALVSDDTAAKDASDEARVMEVASGWELDEPFTLENVRTLCQHYHGAGPAITKAYLRAFIEARLGN